MQNPSDFLLARKKEELALEEQKQKLREGLPFLYGWAWYEWAYTFFESTNKLNLLCAANQISKSSTQIRKAIDWATNVKKWPLLWRAKPTQFWYLYPTKDVAKIEFETKWKQFLPRGEYKNHPVYGWREEWQNKSLFAIHFNSGVHIYFKTYAQDEAHLQSGTCDAIFCDEELPTHHLDELLMRLAATDGYFHMVFTATLGQEYWRKAIEPRNKEEEIYPEALKIQVSMFDCLTYRDGTPSHWTHERISRQMKLCGSKAEIQKRIYGKFIVVGGLKYESFEREKNMKPRRPGQQTPRSWSVYSAVDYGSGGKEGHPSAVLFVCVDPLFRSARVFRGWRGDGIQTTASDALLKMIELREKLTVSAQLYDQGCKDLETIATSMGESLLPSNKSHEVGENIVNVLFKNQMLYIYEGDPELEKLATELSTLKKDTPKNKAKDDLADTLRYICAHIPWDLSWITGIDLSLVTPEDRALTEVEERRKGFDEPTEAERQEAEMAQEFEEWNELYEG
jgi:hypothetical protein